MFYFEGQMICEAGLSGLMDYLEDCEWPLELYHEGYDQAECLRNDQDSPVEFTMDTSEGPEYVFEGRVGEADLESAVELLQSFADCLCEAEIPHRIELFDDGDEMVESFVFMWDEDEEQDADIGFAGDAFDGDSDETGDDAASADEEE